MIDSLTRAVTWVLALAKNPGIYGTMDLIDLPLTRDQFDGFSADIVSALCAATQADLREWSGRLLDGWATNDAEAIGRARHALKGLCGNYGAQALIEISATPLDAPDTQAAFQYCVEATISAILAVADTRSAD